VLDQGVRRTIIVQWQWPRPRFNANYIQAADHALPGQDPAPVSSGEQA